MVKAMNMASIGLDPARFGAHLLRIGGATAALAAGLSPAAIRAAGRWASDVYMLYTLCNMGGRRGPLPAADSEEAAPRPSEPDPAATCSQSASPRLQLHEGGRRNEGARGRRVAAGGAARAPVTRTGRSGTWFCTHSPTALLTLDDVVDPLDS